jgi:hypothetical protein
MASGACFEIGVSEDFRSSGRKIGFDGTRKSILNPASLAEGCGAADIFFVGTTRLQRAEH